jgi:hypothetical protein
MHLVYVAGTHKRKVNCAMSVTIEYILRMRDKLLHFHEKTGQFIQSNGSVPDIGSQARVEQAGYPRPQSIVSALAIGTQLIEYGGEHLTAFVKTVTEPVEVIACWTCVRSMLESCALSAWLLDPEIDAHTRVGRVFALRYEGMEQQLKFGRATNQPPAEIASLEARIDEVERDALALGFTPVVNRNHDRIGIAQSMPNATEMIKRMLDEEIMYRMLSGVAHGHHWAINQLSYQPSKRGDLDIGGVLAKPFEKTTNWKGIALLGVTALTAIARPLWNQCRYFGWNPLHLEEIFESTADGLDMTTHSRFWRS